MKDFVPPAVSCERCGHPYTRLLWTKFEATPTDGCECGGLGKRAQYQFACEKCQHSFAVDVPRGDG